MLASSWARWVAGVVSRIHHGIGDWGRSYALGRFAEEAAGANGSRPDTQLQGHLLRHIAAHVLKCCIHTDNSIVCGGG